MNTNPMITNPSNNPPFAFTVIGAASEFGHAFTRHCAANGHTVAALVHSRHEAQDASRHGAHSIIVDTNNVNEMADALRTIDAPVVVNLLTQQSNSLLHDGAYFKDIAKKVLPQTQTLIAAASSASVPFLVHTSYAFLYGSAIGAVETTPLMLPGNQSAIQAAIATETAVVQGDVPYAIARLGYLYGPESKDLHAYITSFKLHRPYFAGPRGTLGNWVHTVDAIAAILLIAEHKAKGEIYNVVDGTPIQFKDVINQLAHLNGFKSPWRIPPQYSFTARLVIKEPQIMLLNESLTVNAAKIRQLGWAPAFPDVRLGLTDIVKSWQTSPAK